MDICLSKLNQTNQNSRTAIKIINKSKYMAKMQIQVYAICLIPEANFEFDNRKKLCKEPQFAGKNEKQNLFHPPKNFSCVALGSLQKLKKGSNHDVFSIFDN